MRNRIFIFLLLLLSAYTVGFSQVVVTAPAQPTDADQTVITFDATKGDAGLLNYTGSVYAHIGVITNLSTSDGDWKYVKSGWAVNIPAILLTRTSTNIYTLTLGPSIREYFGVPASESILKIALVFRDATGAKVGKDTGGKDIFCPVYPSVLTVQLTNPGTSFFIHKSGTSLDVNVNAYFNQSISLLEDGVEIASSLTQTIAYSYTPTVGSHKLVVIATDALAATVKDSVSFLVDDMVSPTVAMPTGLRQGVNYISDTEAILVLFAPYKQSVYLLGDFNNWAPNESFKMNRGDGANSDMYWITISNLKKGTEYAYQYLIDNKVKVADPYTNKILDPWDDKYIDTTIVYPHFKKYPVGLATDRVSVLQTAQTPYNWQVTDFNAPDAKNLVVYELLIRDFQNSKIGANNQLGYLQQVIDSIDYFKRLGINAIEIMPFNEFEGNDSWGYNPNFYFAPDKAYGPAEKYKEFIDVCHQNGIAVIMDMVLNHAFNSCSFAKMYWDDANSRPAANSPWFNAIAPHTCYSWGSDFNHESPYTQALVDSINSFWMSEYKIDGFRFDFTKGFTNTPTTCATGGGSNYDQSRIDILTRMFNAIRSRNANAYVILEHLTTNTEEKALSDVGIMLWGNVTGDYSNATKGVASSFSWSSYKSRGWTKPTLVPYMESHDEERQMYQNITYATVATGYNTRSIPVATRRSASAAAMFLSIPGPKMIWQFGERGYDVSINSNGRTGAKPPKWDYMLNADRAYLFTKYSQLIKLKLTEPVFSTTDYLLNGANTVKQLSLNMAGSDVRIVANFALTTQTAYPKFSKIGTWYNYFKGVTLEVTDVNMGVSLAPGEFFLYSEKPLDGYGTSTSLKEDDLQVASLMIYPQPITELTSFASSSEIERIEIFSITGELRLSVIGESDNVTVNTSSLSKGAYVARVSLKNGSQQVQQIIK